MIRSVHILIQKLENCDDLDLIYFFNSLRIFKNIYKTCRKTLKYRTHLVNRFRFCNWPFVLIFELQMQNTGISFKKKHPQKQFLRTNSYKHTPKTGKWNDNGTFQWKKVRSFEYSKVTKYFRVTTFLFEIFECKQIFYEIYLKFDI